MRVLVLKAPKETLDDVDPFVNALICAGIDAEGLHVLSFVYINQDQLRQKLACPQNFGGLIFTSPRSVVAVAQCLEESSHKAQWSSLPSYVVGKGTFQVLRESLGIVGVGQESGNAQHLAQFICKDVGGRSTKPLLFPCAELTRNVLLDTLSEAGISVDSITSYKTIPHPHLEEILREKFCNDDKNLNFLVFFSPSGVNAVLPLLSSINKNINSFKMVAIGPTTETALKAQGCQVFSTAMQPSPLGLVEALKSAQDSYEEQKKV